MLATSNQTESNTLSNLINYFELCNKSEGKSHKTITWYSQNLRRFDDYIKSRHFPSTLEVIDIKLLREFILYLFTRPKYQNHPYTPEQQESLSANTVHGYVRTIRAFFSWLKREGILECNPAENLKPPRIPKIVIATLSDEEIKAILSVFNRNDSCDIRNQTIFMILLDSGLRIGELVSLTLADINQNEGILKVMGKGKKERMVPIGSSAQRVLYRYLFRYRPKPAHSGIDNVFLSGRGYSMTENSVKLVFSRLAKRSGVYRLHAHLCRHTFATRFLVNGGDIFTLQQILGHATLEMVRHYANLGSSHIVLQHQRCSPLDRLGLGAGK